MRDFFYSKGDIFIAILIILVAALVIYLRVGVIMGYEPFGILPDSSETSSSQGPVSEGPASAAPVDDENGEGVPSNSAGADSGTDTTGQEDNTVTQTEPETQQPSGIEEPSGTEEPALPAGTIQITVAAGDAASTIAEKLKKAGAIQDAQAFLADVISQKADSKMKQGTFTIPANSSHSDIIAILTK